MLAASRRARSRTAVRRLGAVLAVLCVSALAVAFSGPSRAEGGVIPNGLRLVMVEDPNCVYCRRWLQEIGPTYPSSPEGKRAPLERRTKGDEALALFRTVQFTPTFILVKDGEEIDRLVGYGGPNVFWQMLDAMLAKVGGGEAPPASPRRDLPIERDARLVGPGVSADLASLDSVRKISALHGSD
jgi:hypothetical protein